MESSKQIVLPVAVTDAQPMRTLDVRLAGTLADVRTSERIHNEGTESIDLAARLPVVDEPSGSHHQLATRHRMRR
jgi:hypothetical protein